MHFKIQILNLKPFFILFFEILDIGYSVAPRYVVQKFLNKKYNFTTLPDFQENYYKNASIGLPNVRPTLIKGKAPTDYDCDGVKAVMQISGHYLHLTDQQTTYYRKYTVAYGIPVLGTAAVSDRALRRACYTLRYVLAGRQDLRQAYYESRGAVALLPRDTPLTSLPTYQALWRSYSDIPRAIAATSRAPLTVAPEENVLCDRRGRRRTEDRLLAALTVGVVELAARHAAPDFLHRLQQQFQLARDSGWWLGSGALRSRQTYLAEGVKAYFNANGAMRRPDGSVAMVTSRVRLVTYDSGLFALVHELFPCDNHYLRRCRRQEKTLFQKLKMDCYPRGSLHKLRQQTEREESNGPHHKLKHIRHRLKRKRLPYLIRG